METMVTHEFLYKKYQIFAYIALVQELFDCTIDQKNHLSIRLMSDGNELAIFSCIGLDTWSVKSLDCLS